MTAKPSARTLEAIAAAEARLAELVENFDYGRAFLGQVRYALGTLRRYIEDPSETRISWGFPFVEMTYPTPWDFDAPTGPDPVKGLEIVANFTAEDVVDGEVPEETVLEAFYGAEELRAFYLLTKGVVEVRSAEGPPVYVFPQDLVDRLDEETGTRTTAGGLEGPPEAVEARLQREAKLTLPFSLGPYEAEALMAEANAEAAEVENLSEEERAELLKDARPLTDEEREAFQEGFLSFNELQDKRPSLPAITFAGTYGADEPLEGSVVALVYPLVVDTVARRAWFTVAVGLVFTKGHARNLSPEDLADFWDRLAKRDIDAELRELWDKTPERSTKARGRKGAGPKAGPPGPRAEKAALFLLEGSTLVDARAAQIVSFMDGTKLPRTWGRIRKLEDLEKAEIESILEQHGDAAYRDALPTRKALIEAEENTGRIVLTAEGLAGLLEREGSKGYRVTSSDFDRVEREYIVKCFRANGGRVEIWLSWYGRASALVDEARDQSEKSLRELLAKSEGQLFEDLTADDRRLIESEILRLGTLKDARLVMDEILNLFGLTGENPLRVQSARLRALLGCETEDDGHNRVEGALRALQELRFVMKAVGVGRGIQGRAFGALLNTVRYVPRGSGQHTDGDFYLTLSVTAIGCLSAFQTADYRIRDIGGLFPSHDWSKKLDKEDRKILSERYHRRFTALAPYYEKAKGLTPAQRRLFDWIDRNLTLRKDATAKGREGHRFHSTAADANEPRVYGADFCPLLEKGRGYHGALGHHRTHRSAETGRKLKGRPQARTATGGAKEGGLLDVMGYILQSGRADAGRANVARAALEDLRAVVENLGGVAAGKYRGQWLALEDAANLRADELLEGVTWLLFLAEDWRERLERDIQDYHQGRLTSGKASRPVRVTRDRAAYRKAQEDRGAVVDGVGLSDLRQRLYATRKTRHLSQVEVGKVFGVSQSVVAQWEQGPERKGKAIPDDLRSQVLHWIKTGEGPTEAELAALAARRRDWRRHPS